MYTFLHIHLVDQDKLYGRRGNPSLLTSCQYGLWTVDLGGISSNGDERWEAFLGNPCYGDLQRVPDFMKASWFCEYLFLIFTSLRIIM